MLNRWRGQGVQSVNDAAVCPALAARRKNDVRGRELAFSNQGVDPAATGACESLQVAHAQEAGAGEIVSDGLAMSRRSWVDVLGGQKDFFFQVKSKKPEAKQMFGHDEPFGSIIASCPPRQKALVLRVLQTPFATSNIALGVCFFRFALLCVEPRREDSSE